MTTLIGVLCAMTANAQNPPKMKMTTDIPPEITTPNSIEESKRDQPHQSINDRSWLTVFPSMVGLIP